MIPTKSRIEMKSSRSCSGSIISAPLSRFALGSECHASRAREPGFLSVEIGAAKLKFCQVMRPPQIAARRFPRPPPLLVRLVSARKRSRLHHERRRGSSHTPAPELPGKQLSGRGVQVEQSRHRVGFRRVGRWRISWVFLAASSARHRAGSGVLVRRSLITQPDLLAARASDRAGIPGRCPRRLPMPPCA
jgi:hypothetical protein